MAIQAYFLPETVDEAVSLLARPDCRDGVLIRGLHARDGHGPAAGGPRQVDGVGQAGDRRDRHRGADAGGRRADEAARAVGGWAVRNMAYWRQPVRSAQRRFAVALLALDAEVHLLSQSGARTIPLEEFYTGFMTTALQPGELVTGFHVPRPTGRTVYLKAGRKHANTPAVVTVAAQVVMDNGTVTDARIALNAVGPHPMRARSAEAALIGQPLDEAAIHAAAEAAMQESQPFTDAIASEWYRRRMTGVTVRRALTQLAS